MMPHGRRYRWYTKGALGLVLCSALAEPAAAADQAIGSWVLACPADAGSGACQLRNSTWIVPPGSGLPSVALEVGRSGDQAVPVVAVRGLNMQLAVAGMMSLQAGVGLSFDDNRRFDLSCAANLAALLCTPRAADVAESARLLPKARTVVVQIKLALPGVIALPEQSRTLELQQTTEALTRFRATAPAGELQPVVPGLDLRGFIEKLLQLWR